MYLIRNMLNDLTCMRARSGKTERCFRNGIFSHSFDDLHGKRCESPVFSNFEITRTNYEPTSFPRVSNNCQSKFPPDSRN